MDRAVNILDHSPLNTVLDRLDTVGRQSTDVFLKPPFASAQHGSAGIAYFYYRLAHLKESRHFLDNALNWIERAYDVAHHPLAFANPEMGVTDKLIGSTSLYHSRMGLHCISALVYNKLNRSDRLLCALEDFLQDARRACLSSDLVLGTSGTLLGATLILEALNSFHGLEKANLLSLGDKLYDRIVGETNCSMQMGAVPSVTGIAHGTAGMIYACLRWITASPRQCDERQALYRHFGVFVEHYLNSLRKEGPRSAALAGSWCNGSAGVASLLAAGARSFNEPKFETAAEEVAEHCWLHPSFNGTLCCGSAGRAYAMKELYRLTGNRLWLYRAQVLSKNALGSMRYASSIPNSLYQGDVGIVLAANDIEHDTSAMMPLFAREP